MIRQMRIAANFRSLGAIFTSPAGLATVYDDGRRLFARRASGACAGLPFSNFQIEGNQRITDETIIAFTGITPVPGVSGGQVNDALQNLQRSGLFETVELIPRGNTLVIRVVEFPTINRISIEGNRRIDDDDLLGILQSQTRRVYSPATAEQDAAAIAEAYRVSGRLTATVNPVIIRRDENRVDLVFEVTEGRVVETQRIAFVGNREYSDRRLRRVLESTQAGLFSI
jgi:outer membrane protein insertion porin family